MADMYWTQEFDTEWDNANAWAPANWYKEPYCPCCGFIVPNPDKSRWIKFACPNCDTALERWMRVGFISSIRFKLQGDGL